MKPIIFNTRDELVKVDLDKMIYAIADGNYVVFNFKNGQKVMVCISLSNVEQLISSVVDEENRGRYVRLGRKYIIDSRTVMHINTVKQTLTLSDMETFQPVTLAVHKDTLKSLKKALFETQKKQ